MKFLAMATVIRDCHREIDLTSRVQETTYSPLRPGYVLLLGPFLSSFSAGW